MNEFPRLKTGAKWQYPTTKLLEFKTTVMKFVDGSEQRYREMAGPLRQWSVELRLLDEQEWQAIQGLFEANDGAYGKFAFGDPWNESEQVECSFGSDELQMELEGESQVRSVVKLRENRV